MSARIAIVVLNWNGWVDTIECLKSLDRLEHESYSVVVVDNDSTDESQAKLSAWIVTHNLAEVVANRRGNEPKLSYEDPSEDALKHREYVLVRAPFNGGFACGNNIGSRYAIEHHVEMVWILNNDTVVDPKALSALESKMKLDPKCGICGSVLRYYNDPTIIQAVGGVLYDFHKAIGRQIGDGLSVNETNLDGLPLDQLSYISGASMLVRADFIRDVGYMEERYFLYFEELDWVYRGRLGWTISVAKDSHVFHKVGASIGTNVRSKLSQYYMIRAMLLFYRFNIPYMLPLAAARGLFETAVLILKGKWPLAKVSAIAMFDAFVLKTGNAKTYRKL